MKKPMPPLPSSYQMLQKKTSHVPLIINGSVTKVPPRTEKGRTTYIWTRKVKNKTVTVALSREQYLAFRKAINANRKLETSLNKMRKISEKYLLESLQGVARRKKT